MKASDNQIGGSHYKEWKVQPYKLMFYFNGPQAHIASYLLRTKGEDDLMKALHWCDLVIEYFDYAQTVDDESTRRAVNQTLTWLHLNGIETGDDRMALILLSQHNFSDLKNVIKLRIDQNLGAIKP